MPANGAERILPHNLEVERALLGSILLDNQALSVALEAVSRADFFSEANGAIFEKMVALSEKGRTIDMVTLAAELSEAGLLEKFGGASYLASLTDNIPVGTTATAKEYARIVKEKSLVRRLINVSNSIITQCLDSPDDPEALIDLAQSRMLEIAAEKTQSGFMGVLDIVRKSFDNVERLLDRGRITTGITTGFERLDEMTCGLQPGELIIVAARPSLGKTALALNIAAHAAVKQAKKVGFFSLEMNKESLVIRLLCSEARIDSHRFRGGFLDREHDWPRITKALGRLAEAPLFIEDTPALNIMQLRGKARRLRAERGLDLLIVDYLQLVTGSTRIENRTQEVSFISRGLKSIAKELEVPVLALSQLSRAPEMGKGREPQLSDLRDSGSIEQDADVVIFISRGRASRGEEDDGSRQGVEVKLIIRKQRNGPIGEIPVVFQRSYTSFENLAPQSGAEIYPFPKPGRPDDDQPL